MTELTPKRAYRITRTDYVLAVIAAVTWLFCTLTALHS